MKWVRFSLLLPSWLERESTGEGDPVNLIQEHFPALFKHGYVTPGTIDWDVTAGDGMQNPNAMPRQDV